MRRREFLKTSAVVAAGTMIPAHQWASAEARAHMGSRAYPSVGSRVKAPGRGLASKRPREEFEIYGSIIYIH